MFHLNQNHFSLLPVFPRALSWGPVCSSSVYFLLAIFSVSSTSHFHGYADNRSCLYLFSNCYQIHSDNFGLFFFFSCFNDSFFFSFSPSLGLRVWMLSSVSQSHFKLISLSWHTSININRPSLSPSRIALRAHALSSYCFIFFQLL